MKFLILLLVCDVLSQSPTGSLTDLPSVDITEFKTNSPRADDVVVDTSPKTAIVELKSISIDDLQAVTQVTPIARQNDLEYEVEAETSEPEVTSTVHFTAMACTEDNMEWNFCGPRCYQTCAFQPRGVRRSRAVCELASTTGCYPGCFCKSGFVRINDKCILPVNCPTRSCVYANEEYKQCGTPCQLTCDSYTVAGEIENRCPNEICVRGCFCKPGYVRSATGLCVLPTRCPRPLVI